MPLSVSARNSLLTQFSTLATHASLHSDHPGDSGLNERTGGSPAYARLPITWGSPALGSIALAAPITFDVPAGAAAMIGFWTALSGGTFLGSVPVNGGTLADVGLADAPTDTIRSTAHGLVVGDRVLLTAPAGETLPTGLADTLLYYVAAVPSADTFTISATLGGAAVDITANGSVAWQRCAIDVFGAQGTLDVASLTYRIGA